MNSRKKPTGILRLFDDSDSIGIDIVYGQFSENSSECSPNMFSSNNMDLSTSSSSDSEDSNRINISNGIDETTTLWNEDTVEIQGFHIDWSSMGIADDQKIVKNCIL